MWLRGRAKRGTAVLRSDSVHETSKRPHPRVRSADEPAAALNFIIPVRHHKTVADWDGVLNRMRHTVASLCAQSSANWSGTLIANYDCPLPPLPPAIRVVRVDYPPAVLPDERTDPEAFYAAVRRDKGRRIAAAFKAGLQADYVMVLDYDDFVHKDLVATVEAGRGGAGWYLDGGYLFDGRRVLYRYAAGFNHICGSSHIVRTDLFDLLRAYAPDDHVTRHLGSHRYVQADLAGLGHPLSRLGFYGAVYRVGYAGNTSRSGSIDRMMFRLGPSVLNPLRTLKRLAKLTPMTGDLERAYFAGDATGERFVNGAWAAGPSALEALH